MKTYNQKRDRNISGKLCLTALLVLVLSNTIRIYAQGSYFYPIVDTKQETFYDTLNEISPPLPGGMFYGQDANYTGNTPSYQDNNDGTISDLVTGLMWSKSPDMDGDGDIDYADKMSYEEALLGAEAFNLAGYTDWRLPSIKEMYSLILFSGIDPSGYTGASGEVLVPFIDTNYFDFAYGDLSAGERIIDAQMASTNIYVGTTMGGDETMFGVNFADGRIKGYGTGPMPGQTEDKQFYVYYVRGNTDYGINDFEDNGDGTITDHATGLMWTQDDDGNGMTWPQALNYAENAIFSGYDDWRLPNAKELQSLLDYTRSPSTSNSAAIDPLFHCTPITDEGGNVNYPFYWTGTTHASWQEDAPGGYGAYVCFGEALGWMEEPPQSGNYLLMDVHGAGAQRSDPKTGDPSEWPHGNGPQGDVIRIYNYVRLVRDADGPTGYDEINNNNEQMEIYPNPTSGFLTINNPEKTDGKLYIFDANGILFHESETGNENKVQLNISNYPSGLFIVRFVQTSNTSCKSFIKN